MNALVCEMCGSNNVVKQKGLFICQMCGTKYSVEEAKKMMIQGTVDVSGSTVKVDRSTEIENRLKNIEGEYNVHHMSECYRLCSDLLNIDPNNVTAIIYKALADGWTSSVANSKLSTTKRELARAIKLSAKKAENSLDYMTASALAVDGFGQLCESMIDAYMSSLSRELESVNRQAERAGNQMKRANDMDYELANYSIKLLTEAKVMLDDAARKQATAKKNFESQVESVLFIYIDMINIIIGGIKPDWFILDIFNDMVCQWAKNFDSCVMELVKNGFTISANVKSQIHNLPNDIKNVQSEHKAFLKKKEVEKYWKEHPKEKAAIKKEIAKIDKQLEDLEKEVAPIKAQKNRLEEEFVEKKNELKKVQNDQLPIDDDVEKLMEQISIMNRNLSSLGIFKGKKKKALRAEIETHQIRLGKVKQQAQVEHDKHRKEIERQIHQVSDEYESQIQNLEPQIEEFNVKTKTLTSERKKLQQKLDKGK